MPFNAELAMRLIDKAVLEVIQAHCDENGYAKLSVDEIAESLPVPVNRTTVIRATKRLESSHIEKVGATRNMLYRMLKRADS